MGFGSTTFRSCYVCGSLSYAVCVCAYVYCACFGGLSEMCLLGKGNQPLGVAEGFNTAFLLIRAEDQVLWYPENPLCESFTYRVMN